MAYRNTEIVIGHEGEKGFREVRFNVSELPDGIIYLEHLRYGDTYAYPIRLLRIGDEAIWIPNETDTAKRGTGRGQLVCYVGDEVVAKTDVFKLINRYSLATTDEVPDGYDSWIQRLESLGADIEGKTVDGLKAINEAKDSALDRISTLSADGIEAVNTAKTQGVNAVGNAKTQGIEAVEKRTTDGVNAVNNAKNDGINRLNDRIESGKAEINTAKTTALSSIEQKKEAVHTELDGYVEAHHDELKGDKGDAYVVTEEDLKEIGDRVEAEYEPRLNGLKSEVSAKAEADDLNLANRKIKALTDVLNGKELAFETNDYEGNVDVPSGAVADSILKIGGESVVWNQMVYTLGFINTSVCGITFTNNKDYTITLNGTSTGKAEASVTNYYNIELIKDHKYYICGCPTGGSTMTYELALWQGGSTRLTRDLGDGAIGTATLTTTSGGLWVTVLYAGVTCDNLVFKPRLVDLTQMFGSGNEPTSVDDPRIKAIEEYAEKHPQYKAGELMSSQTDAVGVRGKNLAPPFSEIDTVSHKVERVENGGIRIYGTANNGRNAYGPIFGDLPKGTYTLSLGNALPPNVWVSINNRNPMVYPGQSYKTATIGEEIKNATLYAYIGAKTYDFTIYPQLEVGDTVTPYSPYSYEQIPTNLPILRSAGSVHDSVEGGKLIRRVGEVDLGKLSWVYESDGSLVEQVGQFRAPLINISARGVISNNALPQKYEFVGFKPYNGFSDNQIGWSNTKDWETAFIRAVDARYTDVTAFKNSLNGVMLYYELAEPIVTDIDPMPQLEAINVEAGGEISFIDHSDMSFPIPSTHEWVVRNEEV